jgi:hypothetical protein
MYDNGSTGLEVRKSLIEGAGNGLFATRPYIDGEVICEYTGEILSFLEAYTRKDKTYMMGGFGLNIHIDAKHHPRSMGRYINDPLNSTRVNVKFVKSKELKKAFVIALRRIEVCDHISRSSPIY